MTYKETLDWMFNKLPMYQRIGAAAYKADLNNTIQLLQLLDNPHHNFKSVHVAGTNGKGSTYGAGDGAEVVEGGAEVLGDEVGGDVGVEGVEGGVEGVGALA